MGEIEGRLVVGGDDGNLHVVTYKHDKWDKFVRKNGQICNVVCHLGVCLGCVKDEYKHQFVIELFYLGKIGAKKRKRNLTSSSKSTMINAINERTCRCCCSSGTNT